MRYRLARHLRRLFRSAKDLKADLASGSIGGIAAIPDSFASSVMAGVNPIHGIYASIVGRIAEGRTTASSMMCVTNTSAISITLAHTMAGSKDEHQSSAITLPLLVAGLVVIGMGSL